MDYLNALLIEGIVSSKPIVNGNGSAKRCSFVVSSLHRGNKKGTEKEIRVWVMFRNAKLVDAIARNARDGRKVRIVGRIASDEDNDVYIESEHIEY
jgi:single-stranded DNA-binding protein